MLKKKKVWLALGLFCLIAVGAGFVLQKIGDGQMFSPKPGEFQPLQEVESVKEPKKRYDVVVVGTDPEGIAAALSSARNGLETLLIDNMDREILGGLMTLGWLNSIDMNYGPDGKILNGGIFLEWYEKVEGDSFDVNTAANAFYDMVRKEKNIDLYLGAQKIAPLLGPSSGGNRRIEGIRVILSDGQERDISAKAVIDATQDADIAAASGVPFTFGREDIGDKEARMAVTLVFRLNNVTPEVWKQIQKRLNGDDDPQTGANEMSAWGYSEMYQYEPVNKERVRMRGLNIGRQNDNSALVNALQIFGINGVDPESRKEAFAIGEKEIPHIIEEMKKRFPEFSQVTFGGTAPELYVRETRHIVGEYRLSILDVLENRDHWDRIAFGSYPVDIQRLTPQDTGAVVTVPEQYAIPFRSIVPLKVDGLLVVGRSASFDSLPHGSARVIPVGMATGEAAGAAAKIAIEKGMTFRELSRSREDIARLQEQLNRQGMDLKPFQVDPPEFMQHPAYPGLKAVVSMGLAAGGYNNDFDLDGYSNVQRMVNLMYGVGKVHRSHFPGDPAQAILGVESPAKTRLTLEQASDIVLSSLGKKTEGLNAPQRLMELGLLKKETMDAIKDKEQLTNGDTYLMIRDLIEGLTGKAYSFCNTNVNSLS